MAVHTENLTATILIQVGADEPKPIGTIQIPIKMTLGDPEPPIGLLGTPGARGGFIPPEDSIAAQRHRVKLSEGRMEGQV